MNVDSTGIKTDQTTYTFSKYCELSFVQAY